MRILSDGMAQTALFQFSNHNSKLDFHEFLSFVKIEGTIQQYLYVMHNIFDEVS